MLVHDRNRPSSHDRSSQSLQNRFRNLVRLALPSEVRRENAALANDLVGRLVDAVRTLDVAQSAEHERSRPDGRDGIGDVLPSDVGR